MCSSVDGASVLSEDVGSVAPQEEDSEEDIEMHLAELVDQLADKK